MFLQDVQEVYMGNVLSVESDRLLFGRLDLGWYSEYSSRNTVNKVCASGMKAVALAAESTTLR